MAIGGLESAHWQSLTELKLGIQRFDTQFRSNITYLANVEAAREREEARDERYSGWRWFFSPSDSKFEENAKFTLYLLSFPIRLLLLFPEDRSTAPAYYPTSTYYPGTYGSGGYSGAYGSGTGDSYSNDSTGSYNNDGYKGKGCRTREEKCWPGDYECFAEPIC